MSCYSQLCGVSFGLVIYTVSFLIIWFEEGALVARLPRFMEQVGQKQIFATFWE